MTKTSTPEVRAHTGPDRGGRRPGRRGLVEETTAARLGALRARLEAGTSGGRATAARLRRAVARPAGSVPEVWEITMADLPPELVGRGDDPSAAETAVHVALCLYAVHQQSAAAPMHRRGVGLGEAVRDLAYRSGADLTTSPVIRRFTALVTADSVEEMVWHLRGLVTQMRAAGVPLDYARLAGDLHDVHDRDRRDAVRRAWGRGLYTYRPATDTATDPAPGTATGVTAPGTDPTTTPA
ncbi:type I-E CRISPR-associated protein Cse2/CasB [Corynebacterium bovis]|uniref:type I-E CRISPR-associated protein Cse2/CasB n=1 Tax=Corynebacterium bovis TaxID=36808 RepID=UPI00244AC58F|nr:type I-E CRISPR-associated protein Cse2/CasB [Corynebacterium bovis]MDH2456021.1 type I-E CRISPR-associated protein Cse2/CasB [Corynebacterium bovis]